MPYDRRMTTTRGTNTRTGYEHLTTKALINAYDRTNPGMVAEFASRDTTPAQRATVANKCAATYDGPLSSAGAMANGGIKLGGETKPASTGRKSTGKSRPVKMTKITPVDDAPVTRNIPGTNIVRTVNPAKPITRGRVIAEGFYTYDDTVARVKISRTSGKPYAVVLDPATGEWVYTPGVVKNLSSDDVVSYEIAAAFGRRTGRCMMCGRTLTNPESIDAGIGPICGGRLTRTDDAPRTNAEIETSTVADNTPEPTTRVEDFDPNIVVVDNLIKSLNDAGVDVDSWIGLRNLVVARDATPRRASEIVDLINAIKIVADAVPPVGRLDSTPTDGGPAMVNGRLSHAACTHPSTTSARTACRSAYRAANG
jgi:hypothetical protein